MNGLKITKLALISGLLVLPGTLSADNIKGLNVLLNSENTQTQTMAMVLSMMSISKHNKKVNITLCGKAGALADKNIDAVVINKPKGKKVS